METVSVFKSNKSQAIRIPKPIAFPESIKQVHLIPEGRGLLIVPEGQLWDSWFDDGDGVSQDFMEHRDQPSPQERESFD